MASSRFKRNSALAAAAVASIGASEGLRLTAYPDPATRGHPWTVCYGETAGVKPGDRYTAAECKEMFVKRLDQFAQGMEKCVKREMNDWRYIAFLEFSYNIGTGAFCKSSVVRLYNEGKTHEACDFLMKYNRAAGVVFPGLTKRRAKERALCLREGVI